MGGLKPADGGLVLIPVGFRCEALQQKIDEASDFCREVSGRKIYSVDVAFKGDIFGQD